VSSDMPVTAHFEKAGFRVFLPCMAVSHQP
jgi:hypothetical protein